MNDEYSKLEMSKERKSKLETWKESVIKNKDYFSITLSTTIRITNFGLLGVIWTAYCTPESIVNRGHKALGLIELDHLLKISLIVVVITLLFDYFHYLFGYLKEKKVFDEISKELKGEKFLERDTIYDKDEILYRLQQSCFYSKIFLTVVNPPFVIIGLVMLL